MQSSTNSKVVLVVEDDEMLLELAVLELTRLGYEVLSAISAEAALEILRSPVPVDLLFTDERLPRSSGCELATTAQELRPLLPVLLTSGLPRDALGALQDAHSSMLLLVKPYRPFELERALRVAMEPS